MRSGVIQSISIAAVLLAISHVCLADPLTDDLANPDGMSPSALIVSDELTQQSAPQQQPVLQQQPVVVPQQSPSRLRAQIGQMSQSVSDRAADLVLHAMGFLGIPYRYGGTTIQTGFDCSGFVRDMYNQTVGRLLPRTAQEQAQATAAISREELQPGDLVFFHTVRHALFSHVGIYIGDGKFIHAPRTGQSVRVEDMDTSYWLKRFSGARRVLMGEESTGHPSEMAR